MVTRAELIRTAATALIKKLESCGITVEEMTSLKELLIPVQHKKVKKGDREWLCWLGMGDSPVSKNTRVLIKRRDGDEKCLSAHYFRWRWDGKEPKANDVVAYIVIAKRGI